MPQFSYRVRKCLWVTAPSELDVFCNQLSIEMGLPTFKFDAENVYEWGIIKLEQGYVELNISRKHNRGEPLQNEPVHILFLVEHTAPINYDAQWVSDNLIPDYGQAIANLTSQPTYFGDINYIESNDYSYHPLHIYEPQL